MRGCVEVDERVFLVPSVRGWVGDGVACLSLRIQAKLEIVTVCYKESLGMRLYALLEMSRSVSMCVRPSSYALRVVTRGMQRDGCVRWVLRLGWREGRGAPY